MKKNITFSQILTFALFLIICFNSSSANETKTYIVIANPSVQIDNLTTNELKKLFLGENDKLNSGEKIIVLIQKSGKAHDSFVKECIGKSSKKFSAYWKEQIFTGQKIEPKSFKSEKDLVKAVKEMEGAVSYISPENLEDGLKVLQISNL
ncbi:MAG: hypothetical protein CVV64_07470 [Candidatus Wallbacteria bacterium HGW-Wallbacteria-1]|uniref:PBP domain-containing protein n=1 Tax=Candidatus Wallbacteria bacterium HGW-Wallbacteria-1 TaxID=2013854 RepID=A0A2N1PQV3_9BACT|nr:MAG: hypothetical protein CVV64_07470 [Candidatus Wallbacteria bacterium HGW-Wallbacteria-1]